MLVRSVCHARIRGSIVLVVVAVVVSSSLTLVQAGRSAKPARAATATGLLAPAAPTTGGVTGNLPAATDLARPDRFSAALTARATHRRVEVTGLTTDSSVTYANPDGTSTLDTSPVPYQAVVGKKWLPINSKLTSTAAGVMPAVSEVDPVLSAGGSGPLASITVKGKKISYSWPTALPAPTLSGDTATYANIGGKAVPGEDLQVTVTPSGIEIHVVLNQAPTGSVSVPLTVSAAGLAFSQDAGGAVHIKDGKGVEIATSASPAVYDHSGVFGGLRAPVAGVVGNGLSAIGALGASSSATVTYTVPSAFLRAPTTQYPVTLDPGVSGNLGRAHFAVTDYHRPTTVYYDTGTPQLGSNNSGTDRYRSYFQYNTASLAGATIYSATMNVGIASSGATCSAPTEYDLWTTNANITPSTNWNNQPAGGTLEGRYTSAAGDGNASCPAGVATLNGGGTLAMVQAWANGGASQNTALLMAANETATTYYKSLNNAPNIAITYNHAPAQPGSQAMSPCGPGCSDGNPETNTGTPTLSTEDYDLEGSNLTYTFAVYSGSTVVASGSASGASGATVSWTVSSSLPDGGYSWQVKANDGTVDGPWSASYAFTVDRSAPATPTISSAAFSSTSPAASGTSGTFNFADTSSDAAYWQYSLDGGSWSGFSASTSTPTFSPADGVHTLAVQTEDEAGNTAGATFTFQVGTAIIDTPTLGAATALHVIIGSHDTSTRPSVKYQVRPGTTGTFVDIPTGSITYATYYTTSTDINGATHPSGSAVAAWPIAPNSTASGTSTYAQLVLDARATLGYAMNPSSPQPPRDGLLQLRACYSSNGGSTYDLCSDPRSIQVAQQTPSSGNADIGPGSADLLTGNYNLSATDVNITSGSDSLSVGRTVSTLTANAAAPNTADAAFGPGWSADFPAEGGASDETLVDNSANGTVMLIDPSGNETEYTRSNPASVTFTGQTDANNGSTLVANAAVNPTVYDLTDTNGVKTEWRGSGASWTVYSVTEPGSTATTYTYTNGQLTQILAPIPATTTCSATPTACRSLTLTYAMSSAVQADDPSGMEDYAGRLVTVTFNAADPANGNVITPITVARYGYDTSGNLIGEWDPRLSTPLVTRYSYANGRLATYTPPGLNPYTFGYDSTGATAKLLTVTRHDDALAHDAVNRVVYGVNWEAGGGAGLPDLSATATATWGQTFDLVSTATAVFPPDHPANVSPSVADWPYATVHYLDPNAREVDTAHYGAAAWQVDSAQSDVNGNNVWSLTAGNRAQALNPTAATDPAAAALSSTSTAAAANLLATVDTYSGDGTELIDELGPAHPISVSGIIHDARSHTRKVYDTGAPTGGPYELITSEVASAQDVSTRAEYNPITTTTGYNPIVTGDSTGWMLHEPTTKSVNVVNPVGAASTLTRTTRYDSLGRTVETRLPGAQVDGSGNATDPRTTATSYYTATGSGACLNASEFGLVCSSGPVAQPTSGNPLPITTYAYNIYDEPLTKVETAGSTVRTTTMTYDASGRQLTQAVSVTPSSAGGTAVPMVTTNYSSTTGLVTSTSSGLSSDTTGYDTQGRATSYADTSGNVSTTAYDIDGRPSSKGDGKGTTTYTYDGTTSASSGTSLSVDADVSVHGLTTPAFSTTAPNEQLLALVGSDSDGVNAQTTTVTGAGLAWSLVTRANSNGTAEIWKATATSALTNVTVSATQAHSGFNENLTVVSLIGAAGIGASVHASAASSSSPSVGLTTTTAGSLIFGAGDDGDDGSGVTPSAGQVILQQQDDAPNGNSQWSQQISSPTGAAGSSVTLADSAPTTNAWDLAGVEITPASTGGGGSSLTEHRGLLTSENIGASGAPSTFTASYDSAGNLTTETYPNGVTATSTYDNSNAETGLTYRLPNVTSPWFSYTQTSDAQGRTATQTSYESHQSYGYDDDSRLINVQDTDNVNFGGTNVCTIRTYALDADSNRTAVTAYPDDGSNVTAGHCSTSISPTVSSSTYDQADRLANAGYTYDTLGRTTMVPAQDAVSVGPSASASGNLALGYYANDMANTEIQGGYTLTYTVDPADPNRDTSISGAGYTAIDHYSDGGDSPTWSGDGGGNWTRNISGIDGVLAAEANQAGAVELRLPNLHGDIQASMNDSPSAAGVDTWNETTEFGVPRINSTVVWNYGWLGGEQRSEQSFGGFLLMGVRLYDSTTGRFLSTDPVYGGNDDPYVYPLNPINSVDDTGQYKGSVTKGPFRLDYVSNGNNITFTVQWLHGNTFGAGGLYGLVHVSYDNKLLCEVNASYYTGGQTPVLKIKVGWAQSISVRFGYSDSQNDKFHSTKRVLFKLYQL